MTIHRYMDAILYALVNYIAYIPLVVYPFRKKFRYSNFVSYSIITVLSLGFIGMTIAVINGMPAPFIPVISVVVVTIVLYFGVKEHLGKTLMTFLIEYNNASFVTVIAKNVEIVVFPNRVHEMYGRTHSIFIFIGAILVYVFDGIYSEKIYNEMMEKPSDSKAWNYIWITPMSYFIFWMIYVSSSESYLNGTLEHIYILVLLVLFSICSFITYYVILQLIYYETEKSRLEYNELLSQAQYQNLSGRIEKARKARHDLRHHFLVINTMANEGNTEGIKNYMKEFSNQVADDHVLIYSPNYTVNALIFYYMQRAREFEIEFKLTCNVPEVVKFSDKDVTIILGNLLENALNACKEVTSQKPRIELNCQYDDTEFLLKIKNTTDKEPKIDFDGRYFSSSHKGHGIGIESVRTVVDSYQGFINIECEHHYFEVTIFMPIE
ncbi:Membrane associated histidine kinase-like ATPase [Lachnospiraceae bacterium TWA4]|nr:Membrane associated histidine kinase-like ATPase [Lachnospiraceae bacterium TWA4]